MRHIKLLMIATIHGTIHSFLLPYAEHFQKKGFIIDCAASDKRKIINNKPYFNRCYCLSLSRDVKDIKSFFKTVKEIRRIVETNNYDIVHVHTPIAAFLTRFALRKIKNMNFKVVYTVHGFHFHPGGNKFKNAIYLISEKIASYWTDMIITINIIDYNAVKKYFTKPLVRFMPGIGVDLKKYSDRTKYEDNISLRSELCINKEDIIFLSIGALSKDKRHIDCLKALKRLPKAINAKLIIVGKGYLKNKLEEYIHNNHIDNRVIMVGYRNDITKIINAADCLLSVSKREGLPRCVMEAMAQRLPVIGTRIRGTEELLSDNCGVLVDVGDINQIEYAMLEIINNKNKRKELVKNAKEKIQNFSITNTIKFQEKYYKEILPY